MNAYASSSAMTARPVDGGHPSTAYFSTGAGEKKRKPMLEAVDSRLRLVVCWGFALAVIGLTQLPALLAALALAGFAAMAARLKRAATLRHMVAFDGFMLFVLLFLPFTVPGEVVFSLNGVSASREGLLHAAGILLRSNAVMLMILALLGSMEPVELGHAMARLRLPAKFVHLFLFTVRYIEVLGREYRRLRVAMKARGFRVRCNPHTWRSIGYLFGMLLVRSIERAERILAAMRCRGFQGRFHSLTEVKTMDRRDYAFTGLSVVAGGALIALEYW
ncbi:MAG TPA: cobalt ECF transporter T component CbiQ [Candidatus Competibacteraceae bacterium]|nr:cobalt ECF transporter T component CbiQ [Candidatus Competibacteraceae bacterium]